MDYRILLTAPVAALVLSIGTASAQLPAGWRPLSLAVTGNPLTSGPHGYEIGIDPASAASASRVLTIRSTAPQLGLTPSVGAAWQAAYGYAGQRVRLSGQVRAEGVRGWAGLYMGAGDEQLLQRLATGQPGVERQLPLGAPVAAATPGWQDLSVVIDVPADALSIHLGVALVGEGQVWVRGLRFETVGPGVAPSSTTVGIDWRQARAFHAHSRQIMAQVPPRPLVNAALD